MKNKYGVVLLLALTVLTSLFFLNKYRIQNNSKPGQEVKFTGIITETNNGCWSDGICGIKVDNKWITTVIGGLRSPDSKPEIRGNLIGISVGEDMSKYLGKKVEVYAKETNDGSFTIYGNESYYIKFLE